MAVINAIDTICGLDTHWQTGYAYFARTHAIHRFVVKNKERLRFLKLVIPREIDTLVANEVYEVAALVNLKGGQELSFKEFQRALEEYRKRQ